MERVASFKDALAALHQTKLDELRAIAKTHREGLEEQFKNAEQLILDLLMPGQQLATAGSEQVSAAA